MRMALDASLVQVDGPNQARLEGGARRAAALRAQEMCDGNDAFVARPGGLHCENWHVVPDPGRLDRLSGLPSLSACESRIQPYLHKDTNPPDDDKSTDWLVTCRHL
jgi:hypothetical protein